MRAIFLGVGLSCLMSFSAIGQVTNAGSAWQPVPSAPLQAALDRTVQATLAELKDFKAEELAVTVIDLTQATPQIASSRGDQPIYPASVIKLFYLTAMERWLEDGRLEQTAELTRAARDMIVDSRNEATGYIVDLLTDTTSGPELPPAQMAEWWHKRNAVNRYFDSLGFTNINVNKKPWCEGPYGRETQAIREFKPTRNQLTTDATSQLMAEIATGKIVTAARCQKMMELLKRDYSGTSSDPDSQAKAFSAASLPAGTHLWSKAGWTSETRHDCVYVELPNGRHLVWTIFTVGHANERRIIPLVVRKLLANLPEK